MTLVCCLCVYSDKSDEQASLGECGGDYRPSNSQLINTGVCSSLHFAQEMHAHCFHQVIGHVPSLLLSLADSPSPRAPPPHPTTHNYKH